MKRKISLFFIFLVNIFSGVCFADVIDPNDPSEPKNWPWKNPVGIPVEPVPEPEILPDEIARIVITLLLITNICLAIYISIKYVKNIKRTIKE